MRFLSFRQLVLLAFLLLAAALMAVAMHGHTTLANVINQGRASDAIAVAFTADAQQIGERTVAMERGARQYLVFEDDALKTLFEENAQAATVALEAMSQGLQKPELIDRWHVQLNAIRQILNEAAHQESINERALDAAFKSLEVINQDVNDAVSIYIGAVDKTLLQRLESGRQAFVQLLAAAFIVTIFLAFGFGYLLSKPLKRLQQAIVGLGENQLDQAIDIQGPSDVRELGRQLDWLRLRLTELEADKARFLRHISHELKTPLAALREGTALLEEGVVGELNPQQTEVVGILRAHTGVLQMQIEDLLRFNAAAFEASQLRPEKTELSVLIKRLVQEQQLQWMSRQLTMNVTGEALVDIDPEKFAVAIGNLLSNAIRFSPQGGAINITLSRLSDSVAIDIIDQGPGISEADKPRIFEPFFRGERQPKDGLRGSGIGLSIVQEYVQAHGATIELIPSISGTHFRIELPHAQKH